MNKKGQPIGSALTTIDLHDIARASATFGVAGFFVVTPYEDQGHLAGDVIAHWTKGAGGEINPDRKKALGLIRITASFEDAIDCIKKERNKPVVTIATSAKKHMDAMTTGQLKKSLKTNASHVLAFGTAWGLAEEFIDRCDHILEPISGKNAYNHLSVRSAASIYLDRIVNDRQA